MDSMLGIINLNEQGDYLNELVNNRPLASLPFGGRYRLIDFVLSNMVNSGIHSIGILVQHKYRSLTNHLGSAKEWDLARKRDGLTLLYPANVHHPFDVHRGDVQNFHANLDYIYHCHQKYAVISGANMICNMDYRPILDFHQQKNADITIIYCEMDCSAQDCANFTSLSVGQDGRVIDMQISPTRSRNQNISVEIFIMERDLLVELIDTCMGHGDYDFASHCIIKNLSQLRVYGYPYRDYLARIHCVSSYFNHSMELLQPEVWNKLFFNPGLIYTRVKDEPPAKYGERPHVENSLIAGGCVVEGSVENSILFRGVKIGQGAIIKDSIIMQETEIAPHALMDHVICDKHVFVTQGKYLKGDHSYPLIIKKGSIVR